MFFWSFIHTTNATNTTKTTNTHCCSIFLCSSLVEVLHDHIVQPIEQLVERSHMTSEELLQVGFWRACTTYYMHRCWCTGLLKHCAADLSYCCIDGVVPAMMCKEGLGRFGAVVLMTRVYYSCCLIVWLFDYLIFSCSMTSGRASCWNKKKRKNVCCACRRNENIVWKRKVGSVWGWCKLMMLPMHRYVNCDRTSFVFLAV